MNEKTEVSEEKEFSLGAILSVTTGHLLCDTKKLYEILDWATDDSLFTHQLPRAAKEVKPWFLRWWPKLAIIDASLITTENWKEALRGWEITHGCSHRVPRIPKDDHIPKDPIKELEDMVGADKVIVVKLDEIED